ncbi:Lin0368 family putative glycerol transporter subunit [uncultured Clostridium sp.]|uniref:Lin0368 family putative glycerol transporter subunit n=1 Tax=uncultured Clostridium sp. TaxID=59620 RepID=UPI0028E7758E|nr:hypothetical protein [uncultured Clostridium sp.]
MRILKSATGGCIAGIFAMSIWGTFVDAYGIVGGWFAGFIIIGTMWFMNHYLGLFENEDKGAFVDMALSIGVCGTMRDVFIHGGETFGESIPTFICVIIGGIIGGALAAVIEKDMEKKAINN